MPVFYQPDLTASQILLSEEESKHCVRVLRLKKGEEVELADGKGTRAIATIEDDNPKRCLLSVATKEVKDRSRNYYLVLGVAPTKNSERMDWLMEKATEAGVDEIRFIETKHSERVKVNMERFQKIAVSAMKQSKQWWLPQLFAPVKLTELLKTPTRDGLKMIAWCEENQQSISAHLLKHQSENIQVQCLIGPEGDFSQEEISLAKNAGFVPVSLGQTILRTETAALYACMATKAILS